jgi:hypothetical protein
MDIVDENAGRSPSIAAGATAALAIWRNCRRFNGMIDESLKPPALIVTDYAPATSSR